MSVILDVLKEESNRLSSLVELYDKKISELPKGSISRKYRSGRYYCYLAYRSEKKVKFNYLGKEDSDKVEEISLKIQKRRRYEEKRRETKANQAQVQKLLRAAE